MNRIAPSVAPRLEFFVTDSTTGAAVPSLTRADVSALSYVLQTAGVRAAPVAVSLASNAANTAAISAGQFITIDSDKGHYAADCPAAAALSTADAVSVSVTMVSAANVVHSVCHEINPSVSEILTDVEAIALALAGTRITVSSRVSGSTVTAYVGDDYKVRSGTELTLTVTDTAGALYDKLYAIGVANLRFGASRANAAAGEITGTIPTGGITYASNVTTIKVEITACASGLQPDTYLYQIQSTQTQGAEYDDFIELDGTLIVKQRTVAALG